MLTTKIIWIKFSTLLIKRILVFFNINFISNTIMLCPVHARRNRSYFFWPLLASKFLSKYIREVLICSLYICIVFNCYFFRGFMLWLRESWGKIFCLFAYFWIILIKNNLFINFSNIMLMTIFPCILSWVYLCFLFILNHLQFFFICIKNITLNILK